MMQFLRINAVAVDGECSDELKATAADLGERIADLNERQTELTAKSKELEAMSGEDFDFDKIERITRTEVSLLREELTLRAEVKELLKLRRAEYGNLRDAAFDALHQTEARIRKVLIKAGWREPVSGVPDPSAVTPGMVASHPDVIAARERQRELQTKASSHEEGSANVSGIDRATKRLEAIKRRLLAAG